MVTSTSPGSIDREPVPGHGEAGRGRVFLWDPIHERAQMRRVALAVLVLVVLAGCQAPGTDDTHAPDDVDLSLTFDPSYDAQAVLERVEALRSLNATGPIVVHVYPRTPGLQVDPADQVLGIRPAGALVLGVRSTGTVQARQPLGYTLRRNGTVHVYLMSRGGLARFNASQELVLAHELVHALQYQHDLVANRREELRRAFANWTTDTRLTARAVIEGDAMVTTRRYQERYAPNATYPQYPRPVPPRAAWQTTLGTAPYIVGLEYFQTVGTGPSVRTAALRDPPPDTRHLLHPQAATLDGGIPKAPTEIGGFDRYWSDTVGELAIRRLLQVNGLTAQRAAEAASGWLHDRMGYYEGEDGRVVIWRIQWHDSAAAAQFLEAYRAGFLARNATIENDLLVTPATNTTPRTVLAIERRDDRVLIVGADAVDRVRALWAGFLNKSQTRTTTRQAAVSEPRLALPVEVGFHASTDSATLPRRQEHRTLTGPTSHSEYAAPDRPRPRYTSCRGDTIVSC